MMEYRLFTNCTTGINMDYGKHNSWDPFFSVGLITNRCIHCHWVRVCVTNIQSEFYMNVTTYRMLDWLRADSRLEPSQWETWLQSNAVPHCLWRRISPLNVCLSLYFKNKSRPVYTLNALACLKPISPNILRKYTFLAVQQYCISILAGWSTACDLDEWLISFNADWSGS